METPSFRIVSLLSVLSRYRYLVEPRELRKRNLIASSSSRQHASQTGETISIYSIDYQSASTIMSLDHATFQHLNQRERTHDVPPPPVLPLISHSCFMETLRVKLQSQTFITR